VDSKQHLATRDGKRDNHNCADYQDLRNDAEDQAEELYKSPTKEKKKKKKKKRRESSSSQSSDDENGNKADKSKSKKKTSASVMTRINIFAGSPSAPGVCVENTQEGPGAYASLSRSLQPQTTPQGPKPARESRRSTKRSTSSGRQLAPMSMAEAPGEGQEVLLIPIPPGMRYPIMGARSMQQQVDK
ncbi:unnamed protein product, partial [Ixodes hexagonus]